MPIYIHTKNNGEQQLAAVLGRFGKCNIYGAFVPVVAEFLVGQLQLLTPAPTCDFCGVRAG